MRTATSYLCTKNPSRMLSANNRITGYETSSKRSHYYVNVIEHPLNHLRVKKRDSRKDLRVLDPVILDSKITTNRRTYDVKYWDDKKPEEYRTNRFDLTTKTDLRYLHETCMKNPTYPMKFAASATADRCSSLREEKNRAPLSMRRKSLVESSTCPIRALGRDEFPPVPANSPSCSKHLDIFVSTSQLAHTRFTLDQQNGVARKDVVTFYDAKGAPKCRGFGPRNILTIGSYFRRDKTEPDSVRMRSCCRIPHFGNTSEYAARYGATAQPLTDSFVERGEIDDIRFPTIFPPGPLDIFSTASFYSTENRHLGTGWPVRASVDLGKVKGTF